MALASGLWAQFVKFTPEEHQRLRRMKKRRRIPMAQFIHEAAMRALEADEKAAAAESESKKKSGPRPVAGLGIKEQLEDEDDERAARRAAPEATPAAAPAPVTVRVETAASAAGPNVAMLARMVASYPANDRRGALEAACKALAPMCRTEAEGIALADELEAEIKRIDGKPMTALERVRARMRDK